MSAKPTISFVNLDSAVKGDVVVLAEDGARMSDGVRERLGGELLDRAFRISEFKGAAMKSVEIIAPATADLDRIVVIGAGPQADRKSHDYMRLGGTAYAKAGKRDVTVILDMPSGVDAQQAASFAQGMLLRAYEFDRYKTKKDGEKTDAGEVDNTVTDGTGAEARVDPKTDSEVDLRADVWAEGGEPGAKTAQAAPRHVTLAVVDPDAARAAFAVQAVVAEGVLLARDLVNEPANILGPVEFADRAAELSGLGVEIETLTEKEMDKLGMGALLGVAQGSIRPPRLVIMRWNGAATDAQPIAFIGKGVVFDTGGISIKPSLGMEDMKGDMAGAAAVTGLMHALAARKAKVNVIGIIGLVENMPDAAAQRPGDIVTSMSGQTIEIINTDAEGRLVLCDALWYCKERFKPRFMINLATLTGAILVALGNQHAGMFSNDNELAGQLAEAGETTQEKVWRMPLGKEYDKMIDSKFADMKNSAGRLAGSTTAAQFLKRFVGDVPWAHLDIAGTAMSSPQNEINRSWASGYGVRLLDELVRAHYEQ